jgi:hypothetical protein
MKTKRGTRGNSSLEMALLLMPLLLTFFGLFELTRAMWTYHTVASAVNSGIRYSIVHGDGCLAASASCKATVKDVASVIRMAGAGLDPDDFSLTLISDAGSYSCGTLTNCLSNTAQWPPSSANKAGFAVKISGVYRFRSVLRSTWPGLGGTINQVAEATQVIQF